PPLGRPSASTGCQASRACLREPYPGPTCARATSVRNSATSSAPPSLRSAVAGCFPPYRTAEAHVDAARDDVDNRSPSAVGRRVLYRSVYLDYTDLYGYGLANRDSHAGGTIDPDDSAPDLL